METNTTDVICVEKTTTEKYLPIVKKILRDTPINVTSIHIIIKTVIELIEGTEFKGTEQKDVALKILRQLFIDFTDDDTEKLLLSLHDSGAISHLIDLVIDASKGKLNVNALIDTTTDTTSVCCKFWIPKFKIKN